MMRYSNTTLVCGLLLLSVVPAAAQCYNNGKVYLETHMGISPTLVESGHETYTCTPGIAAYYDMRTKGYIIEGGSIKRNGSNTSSTPGPLSAPGYAGLALSYPAVANKAYLVQTNHFIVSTLTYTVGSTITYVDSLEFSLISPGGYGNGAIGTVNQGTAPGSVYTVTSEYHVASGYLGDNTYPPVISGIVVTGSRVRGGSGTIQVNGTNLVKSYGVGTTQNPWGYPTIPSISGSGVTASVTSQNYNNPYQITLSYSIASNAASGGRNLTVDTPWGPPSNPATFNIYDPSPVIGGMPHSYWGAGGTTVVEIYGQWFGTNPQVNITGNGVGTPVVDYKSDTQINVRVPVSATASNGTGTLTVTASNMNGGMFQQQPGGGGAQTSVNASILSKNSFSMDLVETAFAIGNKSSNYSEDTTVRITAVRNNSGNPPQALQGWTGSIPIRESTTPTKIYTQNGGSLPSSVTIPYGNGGATTTFVAKSLAGPKSTPTTPPDSAIVTTSTGDSTGFSVYTQPGLTIPQWRITGATIHSLKSGNVYDWLQARMKDLFLYASGDVAAMLSKVKSYSTTPAGSGANPFTDPDDYNSQQDATPITLNPHFKYFRLDNASTEQMCATGSPANALRDVLIHEARHAYQISWSHKSVGGNVNDQDGDLLLAAPLNKYPIPPWSSPSGVDLIAIDSGTSRSVCDTSQTGGVTGPLSFLGDTTPDAPNLADRALEYDALIFADHHTISVP